MYKRQVSGSGPSGLDQTLQVPETQLNENPFNTLIGNTLFVTHPDLKRVFQMAIAKSVREILVPAVDKSSGIAVITTVSIILKDFATEVDEMKLKAAAITMVRHLAQSLARATSIAVSYTHLDVYKRQS